MFCDTDNSMIDRMVSSETKLLLVDKVIFDKIWVDPRINGFFIDFTKNWQERNRPVIEVIKDTFLLVQWNDFGQFEKFRELPIFKTKIY